MSEHLLANDLSELEYAIIDFVRKNPGCLKQKVVDYCKNEGIGSRVPVLKIIDALEPDVIEVRKQRRNSMKHPLFIKEDNVLLTTLRAIEKFESNFIPLLKDVKTIYIKDYDEWRYYVRRYDTVPKNDGRIDEKSSLTPDEQVKGAFIELNRSKAEAMFEECIRFFNKVMQAYLIKSMLVWPYQITNPVLLKKLIPLTFNRLFTIQETMRKIIADSIHAVLPEHEEPKQYVTQEMVSELFYLTIKDKDSEDFWDRHKAFKRDGSYANERSHRAFAVEHAVKEIVLELRPEEDKERGYDPALDSKTRS